MTAVAAGVMGAGYGAYMAVSLALATDLLLDPDDHARDLSLVNSSANLGQLIGPLLGAGLVALVGGFWLLFAAAAVVSVLGRDSRSRCTRHARCCELRSRTDRCRAGRSDSCQFRTVRAAFRSWTVPGRCTRTGRSSRDDACRTRASRLRPRHGVHVYRRSSST